MSINNFIPAVWAAGILKALDTILVYTSPAIMNTDYEGEISQYGDSVRITTLGDVDVKDYTRNADIDAPQTLTDAQLTLLINQQKYFNFQVDNVDTRQARGDLRTEAERRAAYGLRKALDTFGAALYTDIATGQFIGTDASPDTGFNATATKAYDRIVDLQVKLDNTDTPEDERFVVVPAWYKGYLLKDSRFTGYGTSANRQALESGHISGDTGPNGLIGSAAGFKVYQSNQVPNTSATKYKIIAGHRSAWSRAQQILDIKAYEPERRFAEAIKGLNVYGAKVLRPDNLAVNVASDS